MDLTFVCALWEGSVTLEPRFPLSLDPHIVTGLSGHRHFTVSGSLIWANWLLRFIHRPVTKLQNALQSCRFSEVFGHFDVMELQTVSVWLTLIDPLAGF